MRLLYLKFCQLNNVAEPFRRVVLMYPSNTRCLMFGTEEEEVFVSHSSNNVWKECVVKLSSSLNWANYILFDLRLISFTFIVFLSSILQNYWATNCLKMGPAVWASSVVRLSWRTSSGPQYDKCRRRKNCSGDRASVCVCCSGWYTLAYCIFETQCWLNCSHQHTYLFSCEERAITLSVYTCTQYNFPLCLSRCTHSFFIYFSCTHMHLFRTDAFATNCDYYDYMPARS